MTASCSLPPLIELPAQPRLIGRSHTADIRLPHIAVSPRHASFSPFAKYGQIEDLHSQFGTFVNGHRIRHAKLKSGDVIRFGHSVTYRVNADGLALDDQPSGLPLGAINLTLAKGSHDLLEQITFPIFSNSFVGIVGPSGAGKSTLLQCLGGYLPPRQGKLLTERHKDVYSDIEAFQSAIGLVPQDDVVFPQLTIRENLTFAARLRFGLLEGQEWVSDNVERSLQMLHLDSAAETLVGAQSSGGQRKRLSVAIELLKRPRLLLLDEPAAGLDPASEVRLMQRLRDLSRAGTTVVCTTHQMDNLPQFDQLVVLGVQERVGKLAYLGPPQELLGELHCSSFAALFQRLASGEFGARTLTPPADVDSIAPRISHQRIELYQPAIPASIDFSNLGEQSLKTVQDVGGQLYELASDTALWLQVRVLLERRARILGRDRVHLLSLVLQPAGLGLLMLLSQFRYSAHAAVDFFLCVIALWLGMNNSVRDLVRDRKTYLRDRLAGLAPNAYYVSRLLEHAIIGALQVALLLTLTISLGTATLSEDTRRELWDNTGFLWLFAVLEASLLGGVGLGLLVSSLVDSEEAAVASLPILMMPQLLLSAVATGQVDQRYDEPHPFRPLALLMSDWRPYDSSTARVVDLASLVCVTRPATFLAESPSRWIWLADLCHLTILLAAIWAASYYCFLRREVLWRSNRFAS